MGRHRCGACQGHRVLRESPRPVALEPGDAGDDPAAVGRHRHGDPAGRRRGCGARRRGPADQHLGAGRLQLSGDRRRHFIAGNHRDLRPGAWPGGALRGDLGRGMAQRRSRPRRLAARGRTSFQPLADVPHLWPPLWPGSAARAVRGYRHHRKAGRRQAQDLRGVRPRGTKRLESRSGPDCSL